LPRRGSRWVEAFRDEHGQPIWRSTGLSDRKEAQAMADEWEADARRKRVALGVQTRPKTRVRAGSGQQALALLTQREVAVIMKISERAVRQIECRAIEKLRNHPLLKQVWHELQGRDIDEGAKGVTDCQLSRAEAEAIAALARMPYERSVVRKLLRILAQR
jgi:Sigma-70, region 4